MNRPGTVAGSVPLFRKKGGRFITPARTAKVCPKGDKCPDKAKCGFSHKQSHVKEVDRRLAKTGKKRSKGKGKGKGRKGKRGPAGANVDGGDADGEDDSYIPYYEIEVDEQDEPVILSDENE